MTKRTHEQFMSAIAEIATAERITKEHLSTLSRDLLDYVLDTQDIRAINALLGKSEDGKFILTPMNWRTMCQYLHHFLPFNSNWKEVKENIQKGKGTREPLVFTGKNKAQWAKKAEAIAEWLENESNDVWVWSNGIEVAKPAPDYAKRLTSAINACMDEDKGGMSARAVLSVIMESGQFSAAEVTALLAEGQTGEAIEEAA